MKNWLKNRSLRTGIVVAILVLTVFLFVRFFIVHPQYRTVLTHISFGTVVWILLLNAGGLLTLVAINSVLTRLCGVMLGFKEQFQLTSYSSIANFFGPLQTGPGVRAVYLKTKHNVRLRDYLFATLIYYAFYALIGAVFLFGFSRPWWQALLLVGLVLVVSLLVLRFFSRRGQAEGGAGLRLDGKQLGYLLLLTILQVGFIALWYFVELRAVAPLTTLRQALIYSGAANFALFVSLTPDAIGFREAFLLFSQKLHGIGTAAIVGANVLDRAVYAAFLGLLFLVLLATHGWAKFKRVAAPELAPH